MSCQRQDSGTAQRWLWGDKESGGDRPYRKSSIEGDWGRETKHKLHEIEGERERGDWFFIVVVVELELVNYLKFYCTACADV